MQIAGELRKIVMTDHTGTERGVDMTPEETKAAEAQAAETKSETRGADSPQAKGRGRSKDSLGAAGTMTSEKADAATAETEASEDVREGELVWYNERKGYGFVRIGEEEVFLHRSTLDRFGLVRLLTGDIVNVSLSTNEHGQVIKDSDGRSARHRPRHMNLPRAKCVPWSNSSMICVAMVSLQRTIWKKMYSSIHAS